MKNRELNLKASSGMEAEAMIELLGRHWPGIRLVGRVEGSVTGRANLNDYRECEQGQPEAVNRP